MLSYLIPFIISATIVLFIIVYMIRFLSQRAALAFFIAMLSLFIWNAGYIVELISTTLESKLIWANIQFIGITLLPPAWFTMTLQYSGSTTRKGRIPITLFIIPLITNVIIWTDPLHHLFRIHPSLDLVSAPFPLINSNYGPWFYYIHAPYGYLLFLLSYIFLIRSLGFRTQLYRKQILLLIGSTTLPLLVDFLYIAGISPVPHLNFATVAFSLSGWLILWGFYHFRIFDLMPAAHSHYIEEMPDAWIVLDARQRIHDMNPAACDLLRTDMNESAGRNASELLDRFPEISDNVLNADRLTIETNERGTDNWMETTVTTISRKKGQETGKLIVIKNISKRKNAELEREKLLKELQESLARVKMLHGLLPICANCKNIRDDSGYWHQIENYITEHSEADFSHGLCPTCARKLYPEIFTEDRGNE